MKETSGTSSSCKTETLLITNFPFPPGNHYSAFLFLILAVLGLYSSTWAFSLVAACILLLLRSTGSRMRGLSRCSPRAWLPYSMWDLSSQPGTEAVFKALEGGFPPLDHQGSLHHCFLSAWFSLFSVPRTSGITQYLSFCS